MSVVGRERSATASGVPTVIVFLSSVAVLVTVNIATRRAQRDADYRGDIPSFRVSS